MWLLAERESNQLGGVWFNQIIGEVIITPPCVSNHKQIIKNNNMEQINLTTEIINGEIILTLSARLEDWDKVKLIVEAYLQHFNK